MTLITFQDGKPVFRDGKVGTGPGCCCCKRCLRGGEWDCRYTTELTCEDCVGTLTCSESFQTNCDGTCPEGTTPSPPLSFEGRIDQDYCWYPAYGFFVTATVGCGKIISASIYPPGAVLSGYAKLGRVAPTVTATVTQTGGSASGAVLAVNLTESTDYCGFPIWYIDSISVVSPGSGYTIYEPEGNAEITIEDAPGDVEDGYGPAYAFVSAVDENGGIVSVNVTELNNRWRESASAPPIVAPVTIDTNSWPGSGAVITPVIDTDTSSPTFGHITSFTVEDGGSGYVSLCSRNRPVASCDECPPLQSPESASCSTNSSSDGRPCGEWQSGYPCEPCQCIYVRYAHPTWTVSDTSMPEWTVACPPIGWNGCNYIAGRRYINKPEIFSGLDVRVRIMGWFDDSIAIDGQVLGSCVPGPWYIDHSFSLTELQGGFELGAVDSFGSCCGGQLTICFHEENPLP